MSKLQTIIRKLEFEDKNFVIEINSKKKLNYNEIFNNAIQKYSFLSKYKNKKILVVLNNSIDYFEILISTILSGNIFCPIPYFTSAQEIKKTYDYLKPQFVISDKSDLSKIITKNKIINISNIPNNKLVQFNIKKINENAVACIYYSSGTTSDPKGVMYSHQNIYSLINSINKDFNFTYKSKHFVCLPFGHTASINYSIFPSLFNRSSLIISDNFLEIANKFFYFASLYKVTYIQIVPTIAIMLLKIKENIKNYKLNKLKYIGCGSSTLPREIQEKFYKQFKLNLSNLYGLSETGPTHFDNPLNKRWRPGFIGKPLSVNKCKISKDGEILLKGKNIFIGYYKNMRLYNKVFENGWFKTGDLGKKISKDLFQFIDRKKDLIIKGGINIVPAEIEEYIYSFNFVREVAVVGLNDNINGEEIYACITIKTSNTKQDKLVENINKYLRIKLSSFKIPKQIIIIDQMPLTKSGKIKRREAKNIINKKIKTL